MCELFERQADITDEILNNYFRIDALRGYCESLDGERASSVMLYTLLEEICVKQKNILDLLEQ